MRDQKSSIYLESFKKCETFVEECHWHQLNILKPGNQNWKGQCHKIFCIRVFSWIIFPQAPENNTRVISIFSKICEDICKSRCTTDINDNGGKIATGINDTAGKFSTGIYNKLCHNFPQVLLIPAANFSVYRFFHLPRCQRHRWCALSCEYLNTFSKIFEMAEMV